MQKSESWKPSKFVYKNGRLVASRDPKEVGVASRLIVDRIAEFYDRSLKQYARGRLLDLGCGKVPLYAAYRPFVTDIVCVDWSNTIHTNEHLDYELDLTKHLPFKDREFDTIILSDVLEHIPVPELVWKEMARILSRNGTILVSVPFFYWLHEEPHDYYRYTEFALQRFVDLCGLRVVELRSMGGAPEVLADIVAKNIQRLPKLGRSLAVLVQWLTSALLTTRFGGKVSESTSRSFPLGYGLIAQRTQ